MMDFYTLRDQVNKRVEEIGDVQWFKTDVDKEELIETYHKVIGGKGKLYNVNPEYVCDTCYAFIKKIGSYIYFKDGREHTVWEGIEGAEELDMLVLSANETEFLFLHDDVTSIGVKQNTALKLFADGHEEMQTYQHFEWEATPKSKQSVNDYYRLEEAFMVVEKYNLFKRLFDLYADKLVEKVPALQEYYDRTKEQIEKSKKHVKAFNKNGEKIPRFVKFANLLYTTLVKAEENFDDAVKFAKMQTRADKFMQKSKDISETKIKRELKEIEDRSIFFSGLTEKYKRDVEVYADGIESREPDEVPNIKIIDISMDNFKEMLKKQDIWNIMIEDNRLDDRECTVVSTKIGEEEILKGSNTVVYKTGLSNPLFDNVRKHGGNVNAKFVFSMIFGQPVYKESIDAEDISDLDIHLVRIKPTPEIDCGFQRRRTDFATLDVDMKVNPDSILDPIENIYSDFMRDGVYRLYVHNFTKRKHSKFKILIKNDSQVFESEIMNIGAKKGKEIIAYFHVKDNEIVDIKWKVAVNGEKAKPTGKTTMKGVNGVCVIDNTFGKTLIAIDNSIEPFNELRPLQRDMIKSQYLNVYNALKLFEEDLESCDDAIRGYGFKVYENPVIMINDKTFKIKG